MSSTLPPLLEHSKGINQIAFRADGERLALADTALNVEVRAGDEVLWQRSFAVSDQKAKPLQRIRGVVFSPSGDLLYVIAGDELIALHAENGHEAWSYRPARSLGFLVVSPTALAVSDQNIVAAAFDNGAIGIWDAYGYLLGLWKDFDTQRHLCFQSNGILIGDDSFGLTQFDSERFRRTNRVTLRDRAFGMASAPSTSPLSGRIAIRTLHEVWQMTPSGEVIAKCKVEPGLPLIAFHPTEAVLVHGAAHSVSFVDGEGNLLHREEFSDTNVVSLGYSPQGVLAVGCADRSIRFIERS